MKVERLDRVCLGVPNLEEAVAYFKQVLGIVFEFRGESDLPSGEHIRAAISNQGVELVEVPGRETHMRSFHFKVDDLAEAKKDIQDNEIKILSEFAVGQMDEMVIDFQGLRTILIQYPGNNPTLAAQGKVQE